MLGLLAAVVGCADPSAVRSASDVYFYAPPAGAIVLRIEVSKVEFTDLHPGCADPDECIPVSFWFKYHARVREVILGKWERQDVEFANLQHAFYVDKVTRDCYVVLQPAGDELQSKVGVQFVADKLLFPSSKQDRPSIKAMREGI